MPRESINAGASALSALGNNIIAMGEFRLKNNELMANKIQNIGTILKDYQKYTDERKDTKWAQELEQNKFNEQKALNDTNLKIAKDQNERANQKLPHEINALKAETNTRNAVAFSTNSQTAQFNKAMNKISQYEENQAKKQDNLTAALSNKQNKPNNLTKIALGISNLLF